MTSLCGIPIVLEHKFKILSRLLFSSSLSFVVGAFRFGRKLAVIRGEVEREIQAVVSKRDNVHTHHPYRAWDPVPSLSAASAGTRPSVSLNVVSKQRLIKTSFSRDADQPREAAASDQHGEGGGQHGLQTGAGNRSTMRRRDDARTKRLCNRRVGSSVSRSPSIQCGWATTSLL